MRRLTCLSILALLASCDDGAKREAPGQPVGATPAAVLASAAPDADAPVPTTSLIAGRFAPRNECSAKPGWTEFATKLRAAVAKRDAALFGALVDANIRLDFGGGAGRAELLARLQGKDGAKLWGELDKILPLGCAVQAETGNAAIPWFFAQDLGDQDPFEVWLAASTAVSLRARADRDAPELARLSWQLVKPVGQYQWGAKFQQVRVVGLKEQGFVESASLLSQVGYRLIVQHEGRDWRITAFVAGD